MERETGKSSIRETVLVFGAALGLGAVFFLIDSLLDHHFFSKDKPLLQEILEPEPVEIWIRSVVFILFIIFGFITLWLVRKRRAAEQRLRELNQTLDEKVQSRSRSLEDYSEKLSRKLVDLNTTTRALSESEERYRSFAENFLGIAFRGTMNFRPIFFHGAVEEITGYTEEEFISGNPTWDNIIYPGDYEILKENIDRIRNEPGFEVTREYRIIRKDGRIVWVMELIQNLLDEEGRPAYVQGSIYDITERKAIEDKSRRINEMTRNLNRHLLQAREKERMIISREVHDELGQLVTAVGMYLKRLSRRLPENETEINELLQEALGINSLVLKKVQNISSSLRPFMLDELGLPEAIEWSVKQYASLSTIHFTVDTQMDTVELDEETTITVFRVFQESLTNVVRHSGATDVEVLLKTDENCLYLTVKDNGEGIPEAKVTSPQSYGLAGMRERAALVGGRLYIRTSAVNGTRIILSVHKDGARRGRDLSACRLPEDKNRGEVLKDVSAI